MGVHHQDLRARREKLIDLLIEYGKEKRHGIVLVFDGWKEGGGAESSSVRGGVTVIYSRIGEKADSVIKRIISSDRREWIVVTSDRDIAGHAWATGSIPIPSGTFAPFIEEGKEKDETGIPWEQNGDEVEDGREVRRYGQGNALRLSKKERAIRRVLGKLR
jgi:predicted RNA-binding protein with PIN domain